MQYGIFVVFFDEVTGERTDNIIGVFDNEDEAVTMANTLEEKYVNHNNIWDVYVAVLDFNPTLNMLERAIERRMV